MTCLRSESVIIRKEQQCIGCYGKFPKGTKLLYWVGIFDGDFQYNYTCDRCQHVLQSMDDLVSWYGGELKEYWEDYPLPEKEEC